MATCAWRSTPPTARRKPRKGSSCGLRLRGSSRGSSSGCSRVGRAGRLVRGLHLTTALLTLPGEVRSDAEHALHEHQLPAMVHLVFLDSVQMLEASLGVLPHGIGELLDQLIGG